MRRYGAKRWLCTGGLLLLLLVLALGERLFRATPTFLPVDWQIRLHERTRRHRIVPDVELGFLLQPQQHEGIHTREYTYTKETDAHGFPNRDPWPEQVEIVFVGDSLLTGEGVGYEAQFSTLVDRRLPAQRVLNLGVPGAGPERQYRLYHRFGVGLRARMVVACWYLVSDLYNDMHFHAWLHDDKGLDYNRFRYSYHRRMERRWRFHPSRILQRSVLLALGREMVPRRLWGGQERSSRFRFPDGSEVLFDQRKVSFVTQAVAADDPRIDRAFASLARLQAVAAQHGAAVVVMLIPSKEELFAAPAEVPVNNAVVRVRDRLRAVRIPTLDLYPALRQGGASRAPYFRRDSHLNRYGNRIVAEQFVAWWQAHARAR